MFTVCLAFLFYLIKSDFAMHTFQSDYHADQFPEEKQPIPSHGKPQKVLWFKQVNKTKTQLTPLYVLSWLMKQSVDSKSEKAEPVA